LQFDSSNAAAKNKLSLIRDLISSNPAPRAPEPVRPAAAKAATAKVATAQSAEVKPAAAPAKSTAAKPAEKAARPEEGDGAAVLQKVLVLASVWSNVKAKYYLAFDAEDFNTPK